MQLLYMVGTRVITGFYDMLVYMIKIPMYILRKYIIQHFDAHWLASAYITRIQLLLVNMHIFCIIDIFGFKINQKISQKIPNILIVEINHPLLLYCINR